MQIQRILPVFLALLAAGARAQTSQAWLDRFDGSGDADYVSDITHDWAGNAYVVGATRVHVPPNLQVPLLLVLKYDAQGNRAWSRTFAGNQYPGTAFGERVALAPNGDVLVAGSVDDGLDWVLLRYDAAGNELWHEVFATGSFYLTAPSALVVDAQGNAYVAGNAPGPVTDTAALTLKYDPAGNLLWQHTFEPGGQSATVSALALDHQGNVLSAGSTVVPGLAGEVGLRKLDTAGNLLWSRTFGHFHPFAYDSAADVAVDPDGRVFVACTVGGNTSFGSDIVVLAYDPSGTKLWDRKYDGPAGKSDYPVRMAVDAYVHVVGNMELGGGDYDAVTLEYDVAGELRWSRQYGGQAFGSDTARDLQLDPAGRVYVVGRVYTLTNAGGYFVVRYDAEGTLDWSALYDGPLGGFSNARGVTVDAAGNVWVTGESSGITTGTDIATLCYRDLEHPVYCTAKTNALGCAPQIAGLGTPSATAGSGFVVTGSAVRNRKAGLLLYGTSGRAAAPFQGGLLCIATPLRRTVGAASGGHAAPIDDCSGVYALDMNAFALGTLGGKPLVALSQPGTVVTAQWWGRDPGFPFPNNTTLTNGLEYTVGP